jgi:hypothetical protein
MNFEKVVADDTTKTPKIDCTFGVSATTDVAQIDEWWEGENERTADARGKKRTCKCADWLTHLRNS